VSDNVPSIGTSDGLLWIW